MSEKKVKIKVGGHIEMSQENLEIFFTHADPHMSILYSLHTGCVDASNMTFEPEEFEIEG